MVRRMTQTDGFYVSITGWFAIAASIYAGTRLTGFTKALHNKDSAPAVILQKLYIIKISFFTENMLK